MALVLTSCAHGRVGPLPTISNPKDAGSLVIIRPSRLLVAASAFKVTVDGAEVGAVGNGEHLTIPVPAGERIIGVVLTHQWFAREYIQALAVAPGATYHFLLKAGYGADTLKRITVETARKFMAETKPIAP